MNCRRKTTTTEEDDWSHCLRQKPTARIRLTVLQQELNDSQADKKASYTS